MKIEDSNSVPVSIIKLKWLSYILIVGLFGTFVVWGTVAPLESAALAPGQVAIEGNRKTVQHLEGGIVKSILVQEGLEVKQGDILIIMDDTKSLSIKKSLKSKQEQLLITQVRLLAELNPKTSITKEMNKLNLLGSHSEKLIRNETALYESRKKALESELSMTKQKIKSLQANVKGYKANVDTNNLILESLNGELTDKYKLLEGGYIDAMQVKRLERHTQSLMGEVQGYQSRIESSEQRIQELKIKYRYIKQKQRKEISIQLAEVHQTLFEVEQELIVLQDQVERSNVRAPVDGKVLALNIHTLGAVIEPGEKILDIVPENQPLIVHAQISPQDIDRVRHGMVAKVRFASFKSSVTPEVAGTLVEISADALTNEHTNMPYYLAKVVITREALIPLGDQALVPGMPTEVLINTGSRTLLAYMVQPVTDSIARSFIED